MPECDVCSLATSRRRIECGLTTTSAANAHGRAESTHLSGDLGRRRQPVSCADFGDSEKRYGHSCLIRSDTSDTSLKGTPPARPTIAARRSTTSGSWPCRRRNKRRSHPRAAAAEATATRRWGARHRERAEASSTRLGASVDVTNATSLRIEQAANGAMGRLGGHPVSPDS